MKDLRQKGITKDSFSFLDFDWSKSVEIPVEAHVGAFGVRRKHDVHKGVDLYAEDGTKVYPVEDGEIVDICPFTGEIAGFPWWENTYGVYVKGKSGIVVYGEITPVGEIRIGSTINKDVCLGTVTRVLKKDKGRPTSMLHLELHDKNHLHTDTWEVGMPQPEGLLDPTRYLIRSLKNK